MSKYSHVIWDWNGTLLNDIDWCIRSINQMLKKREMKTFSNVEDYQEKFCFPISTYYQSMGFDFEKEPFELLAKEYIELYHRDDSDYCLHENAESVITELANQDVKQIMLSATESQILMSQTNRFQVVQYFDEILGISDIYAKSKVEIGKSYIAQEEIKKAIIIGDTTHDFEVAKALGADCLLIAKGHQSKNQLRCCDVKVLDDIIEVLPFVL